MFEEQNCLKDPKAKPITAFMPPEYECGKFTMGFGTNLAGEHTMRIAMWGHDDRLLGYQTFTVEDAIKFGEMVVRDATEYQEWLGTDEAKETIERHISTVRAATEKMGPYNEVPRAPKLKDDTTREKLRVTVDCIRELTELFEKLSEFKKTPDDEEEELLS